MRYLMPLALLFVSCVSVDYMGKSYAPTKEVDLYFSMEEVARPHEIMGEAHAEAPEGIELKQIQERLLEEARSRGANALVIVDVGKLEKATTTYSTTEGRGGGPEYWVDEKGKLHHSGKSRSTTTATTTVQHDTVVKATLIHYKD